MRFPRIKPGDRFGRLRVIRLSPIRKCKQRVWVCQCDCGDSKEILAENLKTGASRSCGCIRVEMATEKAKTLSLTHGESHTAAEYHSWSGILARCTNPTDKAYNRYGGRGIKVCDQWRHSYETFLADVGRRPSPKHSIDRFPNNDGNYEPGNVRWATRIEQNRNKRTNRFLTAGEETHVVSEWAELTGRSVACILARIKRGWTPEQAVTTPLHGGL
jgi:hypothetical protein